MPSSLDSSVLVAWVEAAIGALRAHADELDRINVFPVADRDTGTNMLLTMQAAAAAVEGVDDDVARALAKGACHGARGNSGVLLSQLLRGVADARDAGLGAVLTRSAELARRALSQPREGTMLTVLTAAAAAADHAGLVAATVAATDAAAEAVRGTTAQLPELARAGVVDAGGLGIYLVLDALASVVTGRPATGLPDSWRLPVRGRDLLVGEREGGSPEFDHEVMYLLDDVDEAAAADLRRELDGLGDCVAVVGDGAGTWNVHVHCADIGAAIEAGIAVGRPRRITVIRFPDVPPDGRFVRARGVLLVVPGPEIAELARSAGAHVVERSRGLPPSVDALTSALAATGARHVVLFPGDADLMATAEEAAVRARGAGQDVLVMPTASVLQGLSALAVHDPARRAGDDVVAMAEAAAGTRTAGLLVAESEALTWVGRCDAGDVLAISDGEVVLIAPDLSVGALWLAHRMLLAGGELVTALLGAGVEDGLADGLVLDLRRSHPEVDVVVLRGGQTDYPLVLGVE